MRFSKPKFIVLFDALLITLSFALSLFLRYGELIYEHYDLLLEGSVTIAIVSLALLPLLKVHKTLWGFFSFKDIILIAKSSTYIVAFFFLIFFVHNRLEGMPRSVFFMNWILAMGFVGTPRFLYRYLNENKQNFNWALDKSEKKPIILIGCDQNAELFLRQLTKVKNNEYQVVAIIDPENKNHNRSMHGVKIHGRIALIPELIQKLQAQGIYPKKMIISTDDLEGKTVKELMAISDDLGMTLGRLPQLDDFKITQNGDLNIKPIVIKDLLGRKQKDLDLLAMKDLVHNKRILVTGAGGTIGSELVKQICGFEPKHIALIDLSEFNLYNIDNILSDKYKINQRTYLTDVKNYAALDLIFTKEKPDIIFHAAALKHVPLVENNVISGVSTNVIGSKNIADLAAKHNAEMMVMISTDKAVNPLNVMGATKRVAEKYINALAESAYNKGTKFVTVRFGNVLGSSGSVIPLFESQLRKGGPITVTHPDMVRFFMTVKEAVELVLQSSALSKKSHNSKKAIYVLDMGEPMRIIDLAHQMIKMAGLKPNKDVSIVFTGLRPGEKLYEELFYQAENPTLTEHESIMLAVPETIDYEQFNSIIDALVESIKEFKEEHVLEALKLLVPEYSSAKETVF